MNTPPRPACLLVATLLVPAFVLARPQLATITLQQRPAAELAPVLQPLLGSEESVTGEQTMLALEGRPARIAVGLVAPSTACARTTTAAAARAPNTAR